MGFMVPIHAQISVAPSHEPARCSARFWSAAASEARRRFRMVDYCLATEKSAVDAALCHCTNTHRGKIHGAGANVLEIRSERD
jgi:hypothetical protein